MEILNPKEVEERFGKLFCKDFLTLVDEENGVGQIVETWICSGPVQWCTVNRKRAGGIITDIRQDGPMYVMDTVLGEREVRFGPVTKDIGGMGVSAMKVEGDRVRTTWHGMAGAGVAIGACLPQCPTVIQAEYPDNFKLGGAHRLDFDLITPKMVRVIIGMDDTDTKETGASWVVSLKLGQMCPIGKFIEHRIIQLNPKVPNKTTNCCSTSVSFAVTEDEVPALIEYCKEFVKKESVSKDAVMTVFTGIKIPDELVQFGKDAKTKLLTLDDAKKVADDCGVQIFNLYEGENGAIGAVASIGCFDMGGMASGVPEDFSDF